MIWTSKSPIVSNKPAMRWKRDSFFCRSPTRISIGILKLFRNKDIKFSNDILIHRNTITYLIKRFKTSRSHFLMCQGLFDTTISARHGTTLVWRRIFILSSFLAAKASKISSKIWLISSEQALVAFTERSKPSNWFQNLFQVIGGKFSAALTSWLISCSPKFWMKNIAT